MSILTVNTVTRRIQIKRPGSQGAIGLNWRDDWTTATAYAVRDAVYHEGSSYRAIAPHTAAANNEPGAGADWEDYWVVLALGSDVDSVAAVAAIAAQVVTVAAVSAEIQTIAPYAVAIGTVAMNIAEVIAVAGISASVVTVASANVNVGLVAGSIGNVNLVAGDLPNIDIAALNIAGILAAPQAAIDAGIYRDQTLGYKDEAAASALSTAGLKAAVDTIYATLVTLYGTLGSFNPTLAQLNGAAARVVAQTDVVAAFIYDTAKDSDGGAWRFKTLATSWFNETLNTATRGSRRQFPSRALIVVRAASVTIYDLDDAACPMWMVFNAPNTSQHARSTTLSSAACANGILVTGGNQGVARIDFIRDVSVFSNATFSGYWTDGRIVSRNSDTAVAAGSTYGLIANIQVNAVAVTVLPGTPVDPIRKMPMPTIAAGTAGGCSVIHYDGRVTNSNVTSAITAVAFGADGTLFYGAISASSSSFFSLPVDYALTSFAQRLYVGSGTSGYPAAGGAGTQGTCAISGGFAKAHAAGLSLIKHNPASGSLGAPVSNRSAVAYVTRTYNTGWMVGDTKMALAESTADLTNLVAATPLNDDFSTYADDAALQAVWVPGGTVTEALVSGTMRLTRGVSTGYSARSFTTVAGARYRVSYRIAAVGAGAGGNIRVGSAANNNDILSGGVVGVGSQTSSFVAVGTTTFLTFLPGSSNGDQVDVDDVRIDRVASDRSAAGNHPIIVGTVTRAAVASGAELAAFSNWSTSNFLDVPYSSAFDFGTGDFVIAAWVKPANTSNVQNIAVRAAYSGGAYSGSGIQFCLNLGVPTLFITNNAWSTSDTVAASAAVSTTQFSLVMAVRRGTVLEIWVNGVRQATATVAVATGSLNNASATFRVGTSQQTNNPFSNGGLITLPRVSASAPTPAQIRQMYADESKMFDAGAKCLLAGSDNVQAVAYDAKTDLLYAGKAAGGTDVFKGLCRINSITRDGENAFGPEQIVNGDFATDTVWTKAAGWTIAGGKASVVAGGAAVNISQPISAGLSSKLLRISFDVLDYTAGNIFVRLIGSTTVDHPSPTPAANGTFVVYITAPAGLTTFAICSSSVGVASIDNVSVKEVTTIRLTSDNHKGVHADNDNIAIFTDQEVYQKTPAIGLREAVTRQPVCAPYDRTVIRAPSAAVTTNATPTVIGYLPMDKGEAGEWFIRVAAREYGEPAAPELASYEVRVTVHRPQEGNAAVAGSATYTVVSEVTSSMDLTVAANTTVQALALTGTGVAAKNIEWGYEARFAPSVQHVAA